MTEKEIFADLRERIEREERNLSDCQKSGDGNTFAAGMYTGCREGLLYAISLMVKEADDE